MSVHAEGHKVHRKSAGAAVDMISRVRDERRKRKSSGENYADQMHNFPGIFSRQGYPAGVF